MTTRHSVYIGGILIEVVHRLDPIGDSRGYLELTADSSPPDNHKGRATMKRIMDALRAAQTEEEREEEDMIFGDNPNLRGRL